MTVAENRSVEMENKWTLNADRMNLFDSDIDSNTNNDKRKRRSEEWQVSDQATK